MKRQAYYHLDDDFNPDSIYRRPVTETQDDGWIPWNGGECPIDPDCLVYYKMRNNDSECRPVKAKSLKWDHDEAPYDLTAYRIFRPSAATDKSPTPSRYQWTYKGVSFDYYRLCQILGLSNDAQKHALKKIIRAGQSVKSVTQDIDEAIKSLLRWKEMIQEDSQ